MIRKAYVDTRGGQLHFRYVRLVGRSEIEPLVLLHRTPTCSVSYEPLMRELGDWRHLYALDTPGFGASFDPPGTPSLDDYVDWFAEAIDALAIECFHLYGHHTGMHFALALALRWPERVRSLALNGVLCLDAAERAAFAQRLARRVQPDASGGYLTELWQRMKPYFPQFDAELLNVEMIGALRSLRGRDQAFAAIFSQDVPAGLAALRCPLLALSASDDPLRPLLDRVRQHQPAARVEELGAAGVAGPELDAARLAATLREFVTSVSR